jgi:hypothetical protein
MGIYFGSDPDNQDYLVDSLCQILFWQILFFLKYFRNFHRLKTSLDFDMAICNKRGRPLYLECIGSVDSIWLVDYELDLKYYHGLRIDL